MMPASPIKSPLYHSRWFVILSLLLLSAIGYVLLAYDKAAVHLWLNGCHTPWLDVFFTYYTKVGEWVPYVIVFLLLFYKVGWAAYLLSSVALSGLICQPLKYAFDTDRPYKFFADHLPEVQLPFVDGVTLSKFYSFPSGHTTTFFCLFLVLSMVLGEMVAHRKELWAVFCWVLAVLGAYSRIYLSQHFLEDIAGGMLLGIGVTLLLYCFVPRLQATSFWNWHIPLRKKK